MPASYKWTQEQLHDIISSYENGERAYSIAKRYDISHQIISPLLKKHGVVLRSPSENGRIHTCNHAYFHDIDTEEKAYWLGFLTADGCITTGNRVAINLSIVDCSHLYKLKLALNASHKVSANNHSCAFVVRSAELASDLAMHGILPNKTLSTKLAQVNPELIRHYWRGVIDGDGHIDKDASFLVLVGDYDIILGFQQFVLTHCPNVKASIRRNENVYTFRIGKAATYYLLRILYKDATVYLDRKYERARPQL